MDSCWKSLPAAKIRRYDLIDSLWYRTLRCPIRDEEEVNIAVHFMKATEFIEQAKSRNEAVLVHCHEGKSRSVSLILAYLMRSQVILWQSEGLLVLHFSPASGSFALKHYGTKSWTCQAILLRWWALGSKKSISSTPSSALKSCKNNFLHYPGNALDTFR